MWVLSVYTFLFNFGKHVNYWEKILSSLLYSTLVTSCIIGPFLCCQLLYLMIYLQFTVYILITAFFYKPIFLIQFLLLFWSISTVSIRIGLIVRISSIWNSGILDNLLRIDIISVFDKQIIIIYKYKPSL